MELGPVEITNVQGSEEWLRARRTVEPRFGGLTASVVPDVCHVGYKTAKMRWKIATWQVPREVFSAYQQKLLEYGHQTEAVAMGVLQHLGLMDRGRTTESVHTRVEETGFWVNGAIPNVGATPDALLRGYDRATNELLWTECIEIKAPQDTGSKYPGTEAWARYVIQLEVQCRIVDTPAGHLFVYGNPDSPRSGPDDPQYSLYYYHERDDELWAVITHYCEQYVRCCMTDTEPPRATVAERYLIDRWMESDRRAFNQRLFVRTKYT